MRYRLLTLRRSANIMLSRVLRRDSVFHLELQCFKFHKRILGSTERNVTRYETCFDKSVLSSVFIQEWIRKIDQFSSRHHHVSFSKAFFFFSLLPEPLKIILFIFFFTNCSLPVCSDWCSTTLPFSSTNEAS